MKKNILLIIVFVCLGYFQATAQTNYDVTSSGLVFTPDSIAINVGDTVTWTNQQGSHNVNGSMSKYPNNPEFFDNGATSSAKWTFKHVFTKEGFYTYQCDPHVGAGMIGKVKVGNVTSNESISSSSTIVYPNPTKSSITVSTQDLGEKILTVYGLDGKVVSTIKFNETLSTISLLGLSKGLYILKIESKGLLIHQQKLSIL
jgi:plastocyanin